MTALSIDGFDPDFVAIVRGIELAAPLDAADVAEIERAIWKYGVLVFPGQPLTQEQQVAFASLFGPLYAGLQMKILKNFNRRMKHEALSDISNVDSDGNVVQPDGTRATMNVANRFWHTDAAYEDRPFRYSILAAIALPSWGGETQFADLRAAYDALDERTRQLTENREATFYSHHVRYNLGIEDAESLYRDYPPVRWPMVRKHPESGRKVLWVDSKVVEISGMSLPEGRALAQELVEHATTKERVYTHKWSPDDVVMWDNRSVLHRGRRFDLGERREMRRIATLDDSASLGQGRLPAYVPA